MKHLRFAPWVLFLCLLLSGCSMGKGSSQPATVLEKLSTADRIVVSVAPAADPAAVSPAKDCTQAEDVETLAAALGDLSLGEETETIYGGVTEMFLVYAGDTLLYRIACHGTAGVTVNGTSYTTGKPAEDFRTLYDVLQTPETSLRLEA